MSDRIILTNLRFEARHGVHAWERETAQPFEVDVELWLDLGPAGRADDLRLTIDYGAAYKVVAAIVDGPSVDLLETLAERIARDLLAAFAVDAVVVRVRKPAVKLAGPLDHSAVEIRRERG